MRSKRLVAIIITTVLALVSCSRDPNVVKKRYLESGNKYFEKARYKEASIQYRNALKRDQKYGAAHYRLALVGLKVGDIGGAVASLEIAAPGEPSGRPLILNSADARLEITPANLHGEPVGPTASHRWPFRLNGPAIVSIFFDRNGRPRPSRGALIVLRDYAGGELALARLRE